MQLLRPAIERTRDANGRIAYITAVIDWNPLPLSEQGRQEASSQRDVLNNGLEPCDPEWIIGRIGTLMNHFYVASIPAAMVAAMLGDWVEALEKFPQWAIANVVRDYLREEERRPTIAAIVGRCNEQTSEIIAQLELLDRLLDLGPKP